MTTKKMELSNVSSNMRLLADELDRQVDDIPERTETDDLMRVIYRVLAAKDMDEVKRIVSATVAKDAAEFATGTTVSPPKLKAPYRKKVKVTKRSGKKKFARKPCIVCKNKFQPNGPTHRYCSERCIKEGKKKAKTCVDCKKRFIRSGATKYCSKRCAKRVANRAYAKRQAKKAKKK